MQGVGALVAGSRDWRPALEVLQAQRAQGGRHARRAGDERELGPKQEPRDAEGHLDGRGPVHDQGDANAGPVGPT